MDRLRTCMIVGLGLGMALSGPVGRGQVVERRAAISGPLGGTVERQVRREHGPGTASVERSVSGPRGRTVTRGATASRSWGAVTRDIEVRRSVGSYRREVHAARGPMPVGPPPWAFRRERGVIVERGPGLGGVAPFFSLVLGSPPPPPVIVAPPPVVVAPPPVFVRREVYVEPAPPPVIVEREVIAAPPAFDPYADALGRLGSRHDNSRRDGALTLGRIGDPRAVPALVNLLQMDEDDEVRSAAAYALGSIGDPRAVPALEVAAMGDRDGDVRRAASHAYARVPAEVYVEPAPMPAPVAPGAPPRAAAPGHSATVPPPPPLETLPQPTGFRPVGRAGG